jgi:hypothetical protein
MCRVITPGGEEHAEHVHVSHPMEIAELLRETLAEELRSLNDLAARWHLIDDEETKNALCHVIGYKRRATAELWSALAEVEERAFEDDAGHHCHDHAVPHCHSHGHSHVHTHE